MWEQLNKLRQLDLDPESEHCDISRDLVDSITTAIDDGSIDIDAVLFQLVISIVNLESKITSNSADTMNARNHATDAHTRAIDLEARIVQSGTRITPSEFVFDE